MFEKWERTAGVEVNKQGQEDEVKRVPVMHSVVAKSVCVQPCCSSQASRRMTLNDK